MSSESICPACGDKINSKYSNKFSISKGDRENEVWLYCLNCKSYFRIKKFSEEEEKKYHLLKTDWGKFGGEDYGKKRDRLLTSIIELIIKFAPPPRNILDVGCNYGGFLLKAREKGYLTEGYELLPEAVKYGQSLGLNIHCHSTSKSLVAENSSFDIITCLDVNYYWKNQKSEISHLIKLLKINGLLLMKVVDKSWMIKIGLFMKRLIPHLSNKILNRAVGNHYFSMPVKSLIKMLQKYDMSIIYISANRSIQSHDSPFMVKTFFHLGQFFWKIFGFTISPGWIIIAKKTDTI